MITKLRCGAAILPWFLALVAVAIAITWRRSETNMEKEAERRAQVLSAAIRAVAQSGNNAALQAEIKALAKESGASDILVAAGEPQKVIAATNDAWVGKLLHQIESPAYARALIGAIKSGESEKQFEAKGAALTYSAPVEIRGQAPEDANAHAGIFIRLDLSGLKSELTSSIVEIAIVVGGVALLAAIFMTLFVSDLITRAQPVGRSARPIGETAGDAPEAELERITSVLADLASRVAVLKDAPPGESARPAGSDPRS